MEDTEGQGVSDVIFIIEGDVTIVHTTEKAAEIMGYGQAYIRQLCDQGALIATKYNGRWWVHTQKYKDTYVDNLNSRWGLS